MRLDLFFKLNYQSSTIKLAVGIKYSLRDIVYDVHIYAWPIQSSDVRHIR